MSPLRRSARHAAALLLLSALAFSLAAPAIAQGEPTAGAGRVRLLSIYAEEADCPDGEVPCWDLETLVANPGDVINLTVSFEGSAQPHDFQITSLQLKVPPAPAVGGVYNAEFTFPENAATLDYFCSVHPTTMTGRIAAPSELGAAHALDVPHLGVNFLSYWVGVIAFAILFLVYGATFFLFKYNETPATTDHWDRPDAEGGRRFSPGVASMFALVIAAVLVGAVIYVARM